MLILNGFFKIYFLLKDNCFTESCCCMLKLNQNQPSSFSSVAQPCLTLCNPINHSTPGLLVHHQLSEFTQTHVPIGSVMPSNHLILCRPLLLPSSIFPSVRVFSNESVLCIRQPKDWSFSISPSNEYSGLISFRIGFLQRQCLGSSQVVQC